MGRLSEKELYEECHRRFEYREGELYYKIKPDRSTKIGDKAGSLKESGYYRVRIFGYRYQKHHLIYLMRHGNLPQYIDHIDGDPGNNRIENLRGATPSENQYNRKLQKNNMSGVKGLSWDKGTSSWKAQITAHGTKCHIGSFKDKEEAIRQVKAHRIEIHGEFAHHG